MRLLDARAADAERDNVLSGDAGVGAATAFEVGFGALAIGSQGNDATVSVRGDPGFGSMLLQNMAGLIDVSDFEFV